MIINLLRVTTQACLQALGLKMKLNFLYYQPLVARLILFNRHFFILGHHFFWCVIFNSQLYFKCVYIFSRCLISLQCNFYIVHSTIILSSKLVLWASVLVTPFYVNIFCKKIFILSCFSVLFFIKYRTIVLALQSLLIILGLK